MRNVPADIITDVENKLSVKVSGFQFSGGGCINYGGKLFTSKGIFFLKWNDLARFPGMLEMEWLGLQLLKNAGAVRTPDLICHGTAKGSQYLLMEFVESAPRTEGFWKIFGEQLAALHLCKGLHYGLDHDNFIGSLPQRNQRHNSWIEFFIEERLAVQLEIYLKNRTGTKGIKPKFENLFRKLPSLLVVENPSLVHGDLWSGNLITDAKGGPCLIDPAVYYGNREVDIAMTKLFGGFNYDYIESYNAVYALENGFEERAALYNLYPLMVHVNLFGESYLSQVVPILDRFA